MYEEDRQKALAMYSKMFDDADNEQALIQSLISPTRQAVVVARAYDAKDRRLQVTSTSRDDGGKASTSNATPEYMLAIQDVFEAYARQSGTKATRLGDQFSLFEEDDQPADTLFEETFPEVVEPVSPRHAAPSAVVVPAKALILEDEEEASNVAATASESEEDEDSEPLSEADKVDSFMEEFSIAEEPSEASDKSGEAVSGAEDSAKQPEEPESAPVESDDAPARPSSVDLSEILNTPEELPQSYVRESRPLLLFLFILLAVPITLAGIILLLIPALFFLSLAVGVIAIGAVTLIAAFGSGFGVLADILVVIGLAVIVLALGLLFLWMAIWFIGGPIVGLVRGVMALGGKWCYREVPV